MMVTSPTIQSTAAETWHAMGTTVTVEVTGPAELLAGARGRLDELERRWSRFVPQSEISRLNATRGMPVFVSSETRTLVRHGIEAWRRTNGLCDPTVLDAVVAAGYDRSFELLANSTQPAAPWSPNSMVPGCAGIEVDDELGCVTLPQGVGFDPGGIGKGLAADMLADWLLGHGATGAFISVGGDIRMAGNAPEGDGWLIDVRTVEDESPFARLALRGGAVATSTTARRRWTAGAEQRHHVVDPRTGRSAVADAVTATVITGDAWWSEALATELLLTAATDRAALVGDGAAIVVTQTGERELLGRVERYLR